MATCFLITSKVFLYVFDVENEPVNLHVSSGKKVLRLGVNYYNDVFFKKW